MKIKSSVTLLYAKPYSFMDEKTAEMKTGISAYYIDTIDQKPQEINEEKGYMPTKVNIPTELKNQIRDVPGNYEIEMDLQKSNVGFRAKLVSLKEIQKK